MKIPRTLNIGGYTYDVIMRKREEGDGTSNPASCNTSSQKIWIEKRQAQEQKESSLIHEFLEVINHIYNLELPHKTITILEASVYQVLKDNNMLK